MRKETTHELKILPKYFHDVVTLNKRFELRKNDRNFQLYDYVDLREFNPETKLYTGNWCHCKVTYILDSQEFKLLGNYVILSIHLIGVYYNTSKE